MRERRLIMQKNDVDYKKLIEIKHWVFDLDNTLYPHGANLFSQVDRKMGEFIQSMFDVSYDDAKVMQKKYFMEHGTTLRGLMSEQGIEPYDYLKFVHDIDFSVLNVDGVLNEALHKLPGEKFIYTNASTEYAKNVLKHIGLDGFFQDFFDIHDADFLPKPHEVSYHKMIDKFDIDPNVSIMVEDIAGNLKPAAELGMATVWVNTGVHWSDNGVKETRIDHVAPDLSSWLSNVTKNMG